MVCQLTNKHPEKHIMYSVKLREVFPNGVSASSRYEQRPFHRYQWRRFSPPPRDRIPEDHLELRQTLWHLRRKYPENFSATSIFLQLLVYNKTAGFARFILTLFMPLTFHKPATITSDRTQYVRIRTSRYYEVHMKSNNYRDIRLRNWGKMYKLQLLCSH